MTTVTYIYEDGELRSQTPQPPALMSRVHLGAISEHARLVLEIEAPISMETELARRLDVVRAMLLDGEYTAKQLAPPLIRLLNAIIT